MGWERYLGNRRSSRNLRGRAQAVRAVLEGLESRCLLSGASPLEAAAEVGEPAGDRVTTVAPVGTSHELAVLGSRLLFQANTGQLWATDGTPAGTQRLATFNNGGYEYPEFRMEPAGGSMFLAGSDSATGMELWKTDGTPEGTVLVKDINPGLASSKPTMLTALGAELFFFASDAVGMGLWKSDGTAEGTVLLKRIACSTREYWSVTRMVALNGELYFGADDGVHGVEIWKTDGTEAGTVLVHDVNPGSAGGYVFEAASDGVSVYFCARTPAYGESLWKTDGTSAGTVPVRDAGGGVVGGTPHEFGQVGNAMLFSTLVGYDGSRLWRTDGTGQGTWAVKTAMDYSYQNADMSPPVGLNGLGYFLEWGSADGFSLWRTDGTPGGTQRVAPLPAIPASYDLLVYQEQLFMLCANNEVWTSDGTPEGTVLAARIPGQINGSLVDLTPLGTSLYVVAYTTGQLLRLDIVRGLTTTALESSASRTSYGEAVMLTATVSAADAVPAGTITFRSSSTILGTAPVDGQGRATLTLSDLPAGIHSITARYGGSDEHVASMSTAISQEIMRLPAVASVSASAPSVEYGQQLALTAVVSSTVSPAGNVSFYAGEMLLGTVSLDAQGIASFATSAIPGGSHAITAVFDGGANHEACVSDPVQLEVSRVPVSLSLQVGQWTNALIPVTNHRELVYDRVRNQLLILGNGIQRYDMATGQLLAPIAIPAGHDFDIAPDGSAVYVTDPTAYSGAGGYERRIYRVDLETGIVTSVTYTASTYEAAGASIAVASNGRAYFITSSFLGSTATSRVRHLAVGTGVVSVATDSAGHGFNYATGDVLIQRSADANAIVVLYRNSLSSSLTRQPVYVRFEPDQHAGGSVFNVPVSAGAFALSRDGSLIALDDSTSGIRIVRPVGTSLQEVASIPGLHGGLLFDPVRDVLYVADPVSDTVIACNPVTGARLFSIPIGEDFSTVPSSGAGIMAASADGNTLFLATPSGVRAIALKPAAITAAGTSVVLTASLQGSAPGAPAGGEVTFTDEATGAALGTAPVVGGVAVLRLGTLPVGQLHIVAAYSGDSSHMPATAAQDVSVLAGRATVALASSGPVSAGTAPTLTATITPSFAVVPTGTVQFMEGSTLLGTVPLVNGAATFQPAGLGAGVHAITAVYSGDGNLIPASSAPVSQYIRDSVSITLAASTAQSMYGQVVTFTATVSSPSGMPTGTVTFRDGAATIGTAPIGPTGQASLDFRWLLAGPHDINAFIDATDLYEEGQSQPLDIAVARAGTTMSMGVDYGWLRTIGGVFNLVAQVSSVVAGGPVPMGVVVFTDLDSGQTLATVPLDGQNARLAFRPDHVGEFRVGATYTGSPEYTAVSVQFPVLTVTAGTPAVQLWSSGLSWPGHVPTLSATVTPQFGPMPTGSITFMEGEAIIGTAVLADGVASLRLPDLPAGTHVITAHYSGDANYTAAVSAAVLQRVTHSTAAVTLTASAPASMPGGRPTFAALVSPDLLGQSPYVSFHIDGASVGLATLDINGEAVWTSPDLSVGRHQVRALYGVGGSAVTSDILEHEVKASPTTTTLALVGQQVVWGQSVLVSVNVTRELTSGHSFFGNVWIMEGSVRVAEGSFDGSAVQIEVPGLSAGIHALRACYAGRGLGTDDTDLYAPSTSADLHVRILPAPTVVLLEMVDSSEAQGRPVSFVAGVRLAAPGGGAVDGRITFMAGLTVLGSAPLSGGVATLTVDSLAAGVHAITAVYEGGGNAATSVSPPVFQQITRATVVDLMILYTPLARKRMGGTAAMREVVDQAVWETNLAFTNSRIPVSIRLVYAGETSYRESGELTTDLDRLALTRDRHMDEIHKLRNRYGADLVSLFVGKGDVGGLAFSLTSSRANVAAKLGFNVVLAGQATAPTFTLAHELGHNFGARHDTDNEDGQGLFPYAHGYRFSAGGRLYHDIMAYDPGRTIPYFSNPRVRYRGVPVGDAGVADSARVITRTAGFVASYRGSAPANPVSASRPTQAVAASRPVRVPAPAKAPAIPAAAFNRRWRIVSDWADDILA